MIKSINWKKILQYCIFNKSIRNIFRAKNYIVLIFFIVLLQSNFVLSFEQNFVNKNNSFVVEPKIVFVSGKPSGYFNIVPYVKGSDDINIIITYDSGKIISSYKYFGKIIFGEKIIYPVYDFGKYYFKLIDLNGNILYEEQYVLNESKNFEIPNQTNNSYSTNISYTNISYNITNINISYNITTITSNSTNNTNNSNINGDINSNITNDTINNNLNYENLNYDNYVSINNTKIYCNDISYYIKSNIFYIGEEVNVYSIRENSENNVSGYSVFNVRSVIIGYGNNYSERIYKYSGPYDKISFIPSLMGEYVIMFECVSDNKINYERVYFKVKDSSEKPYQNINENSVYYDNFVDIENTANRSINLSNFNLNKDKYNVIERIIDLEGQKRVLPKQGILNELPALDSTENCVEKKLLLKNSKNGVTENSFKACTFSKIINKNNELYYEGIYYDINQYNESILKNIFDNSFDSFFKNFHKNITLNLTDVVVDAPINIKELGDAKIILNGVNLNSDLMTINFESIPVDKLKENFKNKRFTKGNNENNYKNNNRENILSSYAIDLSNLNFTNGSFIKKAVGTELWKCKEWNFSTQTCNGQWVKILNIRPGGYYSIDLSPEDPGYIETGVATINTNKPIYHVDEDAIISAVVLDTNGYLVSNASVSIIVTDPLGEVFTYGAIREIQRGIYQINFTHTDIEGNYTMQVIAYKDGYYLGLPQYVNYTMYSEFRVINNYDFDIIRNAPLTIDPFKEYLFVEINITSLNENITYYNFTEKIPNDVLLISAPGATITTDGVDTYITWNNLIDNVVVNYTAQPPLITPNIILLGKSFIAYSYITDSISRVFEEFRNWILAIDPEVSRDQGLVVYADRNPDGIPKYRNWTGTLLQAEESITINYVDRTDWMKFKCMRDYTQCLLLVKDRGNDVNFAVFYTNNWTWSENTVLATSPSVDLPALDVECEGISGRCLLVYENNTGANTQFMYRIWNGTSLSSEIAVSVTGGENYEYDWIKLYPKKDSNIIGIALQNNGGGANSATPGIFAGIWNGSAFGNWRTLTINGQSAETSTRTFYRHFDCAWSSNDFICFYSNNTLNALLSDKFNGTSWIGLGRIFNTSGEVSEISACGPDHYSSFNHSLVGVMFCDVNNDLDGTIWNGTNLLKTTHSASPAQNINAECGGSNKGTTEYNLNFQCAWEDDGEKGLFVWVNNGATYLLSGSYTVSTNTFSNPSWSSGTQIVANGAGQLRSAYLVPNPASNKVFLVYSDAARDAGCSLWTGTSWDGSGCNSATVFETNGATAGRGWITFDWFRNPPPQPEITIIKPANNIVNRNYSGIVNPSSTSIAWDNGTTAQPPGSVIAPITGNEFSSTGYVRISSSDDSRHTTTITGTPTGRYAYQSYNFSIPDSTINMKSLKLIHEGYATQTTGLTASSFYIYFYNWSSDTYVLQKTVFASSVDVISEVTITSGFNDFIRNRQFYVLIEGSFAIGTGSNARADINTDYIGVEIESIPMLSRNVTVNASAIDDDGISVCEWAFFNTTSQINSLTTMSYTTSTYYYNVSNITGINDGFYNLTVFCNDTLNNRRNSSVYVYIDNTAPSIILYNPQNNSNITVNYALFSWNVTDLIYEVLSCNVTIDNVVRAANVYSTHGENTTKNITGITDGTHYWNVTCIDDAGNRNTSQTWRFDSDTTAPAVTLVFPQNNAFVRNNPLDLNFTVSDAHDIVNCSLYLDGSLNQTIFNVNKSINNNFTFINLQQGLHYWNVSCYDSFGFRGFSSNRNFTYDTTSPIIYLNITSGTIFNGTTPVLNYTAIDNIDTNLTCNITVNSVVEAFNIPSLNNTLKSVTVPLLDGYKQWNVTCWDDAGNINTSETRIFQVVGGPLVVLQSPYNGFVGNGSNITLKYFAQDGNGVANCSLYINDILNQTNTSIINGANNTFYINNFEEGSYNWSVTCYDTNGYPGNSNTWRIISDRSKPVITLLYPNGITLNTTPVYFNFTFTDTYSPNASCNITIDNTVSPGNANFIVYNGTITSRSQTVTNGLHYWNVTCIDLGNNINTSITWNFTVNVTFPVNVTVIADKIQYQEGELSLINFTTRNETLGGISTNITISYIFTNNTYSDMPWWNSSWKYRKPVYINNSNTTQRVNKAMLLNVTVPYGTITDCRELRVISDIDLSVMDSGVLSGDDVTYCNIYFIGTVSGSAVNENNYHLYYGNPNATYYNNSINIIGNIVAENLFFDAFNALTSNWTASSADWDISTADPLTGSHAHIDGPVTNATIRLSNTLLNTIDFSKYDIVNLSFTWGIDGTWDASPLDFLAYDFTNNSGTSWNQISVLNGGLGAITQTVSISLNNSYKVNGFNIRFRSTVDLATEDGGFDDFNITGYYYIGNISTGLGNQQILINISNAQTNASGRYNESFNTLGRIYGNYSVVAYAYPPSINYRPGWGFDWFEIIADNFGPVITLLYPQNKSSLRSGIINFNYTAIDYANDVANCSLYINDILNQTNTTINESTTNTFNLYLGEGLYYWFIRCFDTLGSASNSSTYNLTIDDTPPNIVAISPNNTIVPSGTVIFTYNISDNFDNLLLCNITTDLGISKLFNATSFIVGTVNLTNITDGLHYWNVTCWDDSGNNATSQTLNFTAASIPIVTLDNPYNGYGVNSTNITLYYYLSSNNINNCSLILNNNINQTKNASEIFYTANDGLNNFTLNNMAYGIYNWSVICFDTNNFNGTSEKWIFHLDNDIPNITLIYPNNNQVVYSRNINFTFNVTDIDDVLVCNLTLDGVYNRTFNASRGLSYVYVTGLSVTNHNWSIDCMDNAGFIGYSETFNFTINSNVNIVLVSPANNYSTNTGNVNLTYIPNSPADFDLGFCDLYLNYAIYETHVALSSGVQDKFVLTGLASGTYDWYINCTDSVGKNNISEIRTFIIDTQAPIVTTYYPNGNVFSNSTVFFNWSATDNYDSILLCSVNINGSTKSPVQTNNNTVANATYSGLPDGLLFWNVSCIDDAGNTGYSSNKNFTIQEPPIITLNNPLNNSRTKNQNITFYYTPTDNSGNISNCSIYLDGLLNQTNTTLTASGVQRNFTINNIAAGYHNWSVICYDPSGNMGNSPIYNFYIDLYPPIIILGLPLDGDFLNINDVFFNWTATDYAGTLINCSLYVDEIYRNFTVKSSGSSFNITVYNLTDGPHNWSVTCKDDLNNSNTTQTRYFTINQPDLYIDNNHILFNNTNPDINSTINITANISNIGGVPANNVLVEFWDGIPGIGIFIGNYTATVPTNGSVIFWNVWNITEGYHTIYVIVDPYNNIGELNESNNNATKNISVLRSIINSPLNNSMFNSQNISLNFTLIDYTKDYNGGNINYTVFIDNIASYTGSGTDNVSNQINITLNQGLRKINVEALDYLGRRKNSTSIYILIDYTAPIPLINTLNNTWFNTSNPQINISATDNIDTLINYTLYVNNGTDTIIGASGNISNGTSKLVTLTGLSDGIYYLILEAFDDLNNTANSTVKTIYIDTIVPSISLHTPINGQNFTTRTVNFNFTVYDNLASYAMCNLSIDNVIVAGFNATIGTTKNYTATNLAEGTHYWNVTCRDQALNQNFSETRLFNIFIPPSITLISPLNNTWTNNENNTFLFNVSDETGIENCSIIINGIIYQTKNNAQIINNATNNFTVESMQSGIYDWKIECYDNTSNTLYNVSEIRSLYVDTIYPEPFIETLNNTWFNTSNPKITINITDNMAGTINYSLYTSNIINLNGSVINGTSTNITLNYLTDGIYEIVLEAKDFALNKKNSTQKTIYIDTVAPNIVLLNPLNDTNLSQTYVEFNFTVTDNLASLLNCSLMLDGTTIFNVTLANNTYANFTAYNLLGGYHYWNVSCVDIAGNRNVSPTYRFFIVLPDIYINNSMIYLSNNNPIENETINITAEIKNIGLNNAGNFTVEIRKNSITGTLLASFNINLSINESRNLTINYTMPIGDTAFYVLADIPIASNGTILEYNESNNIAWKTVTVSSWQYILGYQTGRLAVQDFSFKTVFDWFVENATDGNVFAADIDSNINWLNLTALSRDVNGNYVSDDFYELDYVLGIENNSDSINKTYTSNNQPVLVQNITVFNRQINNVPIINSTNNSNFITGILWDTGDGNTVFNGSQDVLFLTKIKMNTSGYNGTYDFELRVPAKLRSYKTGNDAVALYSEIK